jgi:serine/threonine protein kinase
VNDQALSPASGSLPLTLAGRIDRACDQYEADWKAGQRPRIEACLADTPEPDRVLEALVEELVRLHDDDPARSLGAIASLEPTCEDLARITDPDLHASLTRVITRERDGAIGTRGCRWVGTPSTSGFRFRILRPHAEGGLGRVYLARDEELRREVALKQIQDRHAHDPTSRARFLMEAELTGKLEHPGVVPVYGLGCDADGRPYYAMRFIRGDSFKQAIARFHAMDDPKRDPGERALALRLLLGQLVNVCNTVAYAHSRGVIHRDLKPDNILLGPYGETWVVDWGLAKLAGQPEGVGRAEGTLQLESASASDATFPGAPLGTPQYMSPEQALGRPDLLSTACDIYGLGATL